jgi:hypothetical protein
MVTAAHNWSMPLSPRALVVVAVTIAIGGSACSDAKTQPTSGTTIASADAKPDARGGERSVQAGRPFTVDDLPAGHDQPKQDYVPAEFKTGADRWRDTGVYVDGKPIGMLSWAELPISLPVAWTQTKASAPKRADHPEDTGWRWKKQRRYRFTDYFVALGLDLKRIKEVHVYGPRFSDSIVVSGKELRSKKGKEFYFRFGGITKGKALPKVPDKFGNDRSPDKIASVMIYIDKKPPQWFRNVGFMLDGEVQYGVPYYGEPLRGGVRVYLDDKLAAYIKRQELPQALSVIDAEGNQSWKLYDVLASQGVDTAPIVEAWLIRDDERKERIGKDELATITFTADAQASKSSTTTGSIQLGPNKLGARAIALHTKPVDPASIPRRDPVDE